MTNPSYAGLFFVLPFIQAGDVTFALRVLGIRVRPPKSPRKFAYILVSFVFVLVLLL